MASVAIKYCHTSAIVYHPVYFIVKDDSVMDNFSSVTF